MPRTFGSLANQESAAVRRCSWLALVRPCPHYLLRLLLLLVVVVVVVVVLLLVVMVLLLLLLAVAFRLALL
eukprot:COSAG04_NODE_711_length_10885_cov_5.273225_3_plen_71_part_00